MSMTFAHHSIKVVGTIDGPNVGRGKPTITLCFTKHHAQIVNHQTKTKAPAVYTHTSWLLIS